MTLRFKGNVNTAGTLKANAGPQESWNVEFISGSVPGSHSGYASYGSAVGTLVEGEVINGYSFRGLYQWSGRVAVGFDPGTPIDTIEGVEIEGFGTFLTADRHSFVSEAGVVEYRWISPEAAGWWPADGETVRARIF